MGVDQALCVPYGCHSTRSDKIHIFHDKEANRRKNTNTLSLHMNSYHRHMASGHRPGAGYKKDVSRGLPIASILSFSPAAVQAYESS